MEFIKALLVTWLLLLISTAITFGLIYIFCPRILMKILIENTTMILK